MKYSAVVPGETKYCNLYGLCWDGQVLKNFRG